MNYRKKKIKMVVTVPGLLVPITTGYKHDLQEIIKT